MREHEWHQRDFSQSIAVIKANTKRITLPNWGLPVAMFVPSGQLFSLPLSTSVAEQAHLLIRQRPGYLLTYPTNLSALLDHFKTNGIKMQFLEVRTVGETVSDELRQSCLKAFGAKLVDCYSSQEVGTIALECPQTGLYHVQSESLIVEVLRDDGSQCQPGEVGRVVVTDLHNFANPLIRYDTGDYAQVGPVCPCGRGLPTLSRIIGRRRNMVVLPDGSRHWPIVGMHKFESTGISVRQFQVIQTSLQRIEVKLVVDRLPSPEQEHALVDVVQKALGHSFEIALTYVGSISTPAGKFEEFVSAV
jgi:phenylacetate-CoA ligase